MSNAKPQGSTETLPQFVHFRTAPPDGIRRWLRKDAQRLQWHTRVCFSRSSAKFWCHRGQKSPQFWPRLSFYRLRLQFQFICPISRSHGPKNWRFCSIWAFPGDNSNPISQMAIKWHISWWRHQMETFSALLALFAGNSPVPGEFPTRRPVTRSFDVFFDLRLNKRLSKQPWGCWFETPSLWRHCDDSFWEHVGDSSLFWGHPSNFKATKADKSAIWIVFEQDNTRLVAAIKSLNCRVIFISRIFAHVPSSMCLYVSLSVCCLFFSPPHIPV